MEAPLALRVDFDAVKLRSQVASGIGFLRRGLDPPARSGLVWSHDGSECPCHRAISRAFGGGLLFAAPCATGPTEDFCCVSISSNACGS